MSKLKNESTCGIEVSMNTSQSNRRELIQTLEGLRDRVIRLETGCGCEIFENLGVPNRFLWLEWWPSIEECESARVSERFRALLGAIKVLGTMEALKVVHSVDEHAGPHHGNPDDLDSVGAPKKEKK